MSKRLVLVLCVALVGCRASAQVAEVKARPNNCEDNLVALNTAHHAAGGEGVITLVARLGAGETRRDLNRRRLHNARTYLTSELYWKRDPQTVIAAEGERVGGHGRLEIYVKGVLWDAMLVKRNSDLRVGSCEPDDIRPKRADAIFYPFLDERPGKPKRKG